MSRAKQQVLEYRTYHLPAEFPLLVLDGEAWRISPVRSSRLHIHNCLEVGICHDQNGHMIMGSEEIAFHPDYVTCIARNVPHTTWSEPGEHSLWSYLYIDAVALLGSQGIARMPNLSAMHHMLATCHFVLPPGEFPWAAPLLRAVLEEYRSKEAGFQNAIRALLELFFIRLVRIEEKTPVPEKDEPSLAVLTPALDYLHTHYATDFSMEDLADLCHISPTHFRRLFHTQIGMSPLMFLHQLRILKSCSLLKSTNSTISDIAIAVGYTSLSSFNLFFRRFMNTTPSQWRKSGDTERTSRITFTGWLLPEVPDSGHFG